MWVLCRRERNSDPLAPTREIGRLGWAGQREGGRLGKGEETLEETDLETRGMKKEVSY
jgi:hypothetical protein